MSRLHMLQRSAGRAGWGGVGWREALLLGWSVWISHKPVCLYSHTPAVQFKLPLMPMCTGCLPTPTYEDADANTTEVESIQELMNLGHLSQYCPLA
jgi:hypothetical protein